MTHIERLAARLVWIAPVGNESLRGFMVCKRVVNNVDGKNTRVDYLLSGSQLGTPWKSPFQEDKCMFSSFDDALTAAVQTERLTPP